MMVRETKVGLVVAGSFLCLVGVVVFCKYREDRVALPDAALADEEVLDQGDPLASETPSPQAPVGLAASPAPLIPQSDQLNLDRIPIQLPLMQASAEASGTQAPIVLQPGGEVPPPTAMEASPLPASQRAGRNQQGIEVSPGSVPLSGGSEPPPVASQPAAILTSETPPPAPLTAQQVAPVDPSPPDPVSSQTQPTGSVPLPEGPAAVIVSPNFAGPSTASQPAVPAPVEPTPVAPPETTNERQGSSPPAFIGPPTVGNGSKPAEPPALPPATGIKPDASRTPVTMPNPPDPPRQIVPQAAPRPATPTAADGVASIDIPAARTPATRSTTAPKVESYDEEEYRSRSGDSFESISNQFYRTPKYAQALLVFNRNHPLAGTGVRQDPPALQAGQPIFIPPTSILEKRHGSAIRDLQPQPPAGATSTGIMKN